MKIKILSNDQLTVDVPMLNALSRYYYKDIMDQSTATSNELEIYEWNGKKKNEKNKTNKSRG